MKKRHLYRYKCYEADHSRYVALYKKLNVKQAHAAIERIQAERCGDIAILDFVCVEYMGTVFVEGGE